MPKKTRIEAEAIFSAVEKRFLEETKKRLDNSNIENRGGTHIDTTLAEELQKETEVALRTDFTGQSLANKYREFRSTPEEINLSDKLWKALEEYGYEYLETQKEKENDKLIITKSISESETNKTDIELDYTDFTMEEETTQSEKEDYPKNYEEFEKIVENNGFPKICRIIEKHFKDKMSSSEITLYNKIKKDIAADKAGYYELENKDRLLVLMMGKNLA